MRYIILLIFSESQTKNCFGLFSEDASNFGTLLSGVGTIILAGLGVYAAISLYQWKQQKRLEKKSKQADELLITLNSFEIKILEQFKYRDSWLIYSKDSEENLNKAENLPADKKQEFLKRMQADPFELNNYLKQLSELRDSLGPIKIIGQWLDSDIPILVESMEDCLSKVMLNVKIKHFINATKEQEIEDMKVLSSTKSDIIKKNIDIIREKLRSHIYFEN